MLDTFIIEELRRQREERERQRPQPAIDLPLPYPEPSEVEPAGKSDGGTVIVIEIDSES